MRAVATSSFAGETYLTSGWSPTQPPTPVFALCANGTFSASGGPVSTGATGLPVPPPRPATTLCLIVDAQTLAATATALGPHYPDLSRLGTVLTLPSPAP